MREAALSTEQQFRRTEERDINAALTFGGAAKCLQGYRLIQINASAACDF